MGAKRNLLKFERQIRLFCIVVMIGAYVLLKVISGSERDVCQRMADVREVLESGRVRVATKVPLSFYFLRAALK